jgi:hypothetical protein
MKTTSVDLETYQSHHIVFRDDIFKWICFYWKTVPSAPPVYFVKNTGGNL